MKMLYKELISDIKTIIENLDWNSVTGKYSFSIIKDDLADMIEKKYPWLQADIGAEYGCVFLIRANDVTIIQVRFCTSNNFSQTDFEIEDVFQYKHPELAKDSVSYDALTIEDIQIKTERDQAQEEINELKEDKTKLEAKLKKLNEKLTDKTAAFLSKYSDV